jgi:hypothetical protein
VSPAFPKTNKKSALLNIILQRCGDLMGMAQFFKTAGDDRQRNTKQKKTFPEKYIF